LFLNRSFIRSNRAVHLFVYSSTRPLRSLSRRHQDNPCLWSKSCSSAANLFTLNLTFLRSVANLRLTLFYPPPRSSVLPMCSASCVSRLIGFLLFRLRLILCPAFIQPNPIQSHPRRIYTTSEPPPSMPVEISHRVTSSSIYLTHQGQSALQNDIRPVRSGGTDPTSTSRYCEPWNWLLSPYVWQVMLLSRWLISFRIKLLTKLGSVVSRTNVESVGYLTLCRPCSVPDLESNTPTEHIGDVSVHPHRPHVPCLGPVKIVFDH
jgi:hypothetical protein